MARIKASISCCFVWFRGSCLFFRCLLEITGAEREKRRDPSLPHAARIQKLKSTMESLRARPTLLFPAVVLRCVILLPHKLALLKILDIFRKWDLPFPKVKLAHPGV